MNTPKSIKQSGFSIVEAMIALAVVGVIGAIGYAFINNSNASRVSAPTSQENVQYSERSTPAAPAIEKTQDLDKASATLDQIDPTSNTADLDTEMSKF